MSPSITPTFCARSGTAAARRRRAVIALAADMRELKENTGSATEADLIAKGWAPKRLQSLADDARALLTGGRHG